MNTFTFNTGRGYSPDGQQINVTVLGIDTPAADDMLGLDTPTYSVRFDDVTRHVSGIVKIYGEVTASAVLNAYDRGQYEGA